MNIPLDEFTISKSKEVLMDPFLESFILGPEVLIDPAASEHVSYRTVLSRYKHLNNIN